MAAKQTERKGCFSIFSQIFKSGKASVQQDVETEVLPYQKRKSLASDAELSFYHVLRQCVEPTEIVICRKFGCGTL